MRHITLRVLAECFLFKEVVQATEKKFAHSLRVAHKGRRCSLHSLTEVLENEVIVCWDVTPFVLVYFCLHFRLLYYAQETQERLTSSTLKMAAAGFYKMAVSS
jgi:hypothetical protein